MRTTMKIGEAARRAGVGVDTVRFYERRGILPASSRRASGYREFTDATVERIRFVRALQALGFTLDEVAEMLRAVDAGEASCATEQRKVEGVLQRIDERIASLQQVRRRLKRTLARCSDGSCTMLEPLGVPSPRAR